MLYVYLAVLVFLIGVVGLAPGQQENETLNVVLYVFCFVITVFVLINAIKVGSRRDPNVFWYKYQRHPFDNAQYFSVRAENREKANEIAMKEYERLVAVGHIICSTGMLYPCEPPLDR